VATVRVFHAEPHKPAMLAAQAVVPLGGQGGAAAWFDMEPTGNGSAWYKRFSATFEARRRGVFVLSPPPCILHPVFPIQKQTGGVA
jgi:hypothetical protein